MDISLKDKVIVVTGSSRGIGKELIYAFAREGAKVVINYLNSERQAIAIYEELKSIGHQCILVKADVTDYNQVKKLLYKTVEAFGRVDVLVNNAGKCSDNIISFLSNAQWHDILNTNLTSMYYCCKVFSKQMIKQKCGKIINIASLKGQIGTEGQVNYCASKAGVIGLSKALAKELGKFNIGVNVICPGYIYTNLNSKSPQKRNCAIEKSLLTIDYSLNDFINFMILISSDNLLGVSGQVFNLDSRIK